MRSYDNVPDDWNTYWCRCEHCGRRYHASDGECECEEWRREQEENEKNEEDPKEEEGE